MSVTIEVKGVEGLQEELKNQLKLKATKAAVKHHGSQLHTQAQRHASFKGHYRGKRFIPPTGATKRSIKLSIEDGGLAAKLTVGTHYSGYLEEGTRYMSAQPFVKPAVNIVKPQFISDLMRIRNAKGSS